MATSLLSRDTAQATRRKVGGGKTAVFLGDSWVAGARSTSGTPGLYNSSKNNAGNSWITWFLALCGQVLNVLNYGGVTGQTSAQILARWNTDVAPFRPDLLFISSPLVNDVAGGVAVATSQAQVTTMLDLAQKMGTHVVMHTMPPKSNSVWNSTQLAAAFAHSQWLRQQGMTRKGLTVVDFYTPLALGDATGTWKSIGTSPLTFTDDGTHLGVEGAGRVGWQMFQSVKHLLGALVPVLPFGNGDTKNYAPNPAIQSTSTSTGLFNGAVGTIPNSWQVKSTDGNPLAGTVTCSIIPATDVDDADIFGGSYLKVVNTVVASKTQVSIPITANFSDFVPGDTIQGALEVGFGSDVVVGTQTVQLRCGFYNGSFQTVYGIDMVVSNASGVTWPVELCAAALFPKNIVRMKLRTPPVTILASPSGGQMDFVCSGLGTWYFRLPEIRRNAVSWGV